MGEGRQRAAAQAEVLDFPGVSFSPLGSGVSTAHASGRFTSTGETLLLSRLSPLGTPGCWVCVAVPWEVSQLQASVKCHLCPRGAVPR